jgi:hypothetical protein
MTLICYDLVKLRQELSDKLDKANLELWAGTNDRTRTEFLDKLIVIITQLSLK